MYIILFHIVVLCEVRAILSHCFRCSTCGSEGKSKLSMVTHLVMDRPRKIKSDVFNRKAMLLNIMLCFFTLAVFTDTSLSLERFFYFYTGSTPTHQSRFCWNVTFSTKPSQDPSEIAFFSLCFSVPLIWNTAHCIFLKKDFFDVDLWKSFYWICCHIASSLSLMFWFSGQKACGNPYPLPWKVKSQPLDHQESLPVHCILILWISRLSAEFANSS